MRHRSMPSVALPAALCLVLSATFLFWSFCSLPAVQQNNQFALHGRFLEPWSQTWIRRGDVSRYTQMNATQAAHAYWQAVARNQLLIGAWFALARLESQHAEQTRASELHNFLLKHVPASTPWAWHHMLLAATQGDRTQFSASFNYVLERLPNHRQEAFEVALTIWDGWHGVFDHADAGNKWLVVSECMTRNLVDQALALYARLENATISPTPSQQSSFLNFLLARQQWDKAADTWIRSEAYSGKAVDNGDFESELTGQGFGWRHGRVQGVEAGRQLRRDDVGGHAMRFNFLGTTNLRFNHFWQYAILEPGQTHELRLSWKSERLSTDKGPYLEVQGVGCPGLRVVTAELTGSRDWETVSVLFDAPDECRVARIGVRRDESLKFDSKISGGFWIDGVELKPQSSQR